MEQMKLYVGTKLLKAKPMDREDYCDLRGWDLPEDENGLDEGYLVEYIDGGESNHIEFDGYISWSPTDVFDKAYEETRGMSFGLAIELLKKGFLVARDGWNGKGMFLVYVPVSTDIELQTGTVYHNALKSALGEEVANEPTLILPHIDMWTLDSTGRRAFLPGWLASQSDMLATDWTIITRHKSNQKTNREI
jgi:hypothetical protein